MGIIEYAWRPNMHMRHILHIGETYPRQALGANDNGSGQTIYRAYARGNFSVPNNKIKD